jgi:hypothetical protein
LVANTKKSWFILKCRSCFEIKKCQTVEMCDKSIS